MPYRAYHSLDTVPIFPVLSRGVRGICYRSPRGDGDLVVGGAFPRGSIAPQSAFGHNRRQPGQAKAEVIDMGSLWRETAELPKFGPLEGEVTVDVLIIGGGMAGLLCAYQLDRAGVTYALVEANEIGGGVTGNTTAKVTAQHGLLYDKLIRTFGMETAQKYLQANQGAVETYRALSKEIPCDFEEQESVVYSLDNRGELEREVAALKKLGVSAQLRDQLPLPFATAGGVVVPGQGQFHPLKFLAGISKGLRIYEHTKVWELRPGQAVTNGGKIRANQIIVATHFPFLNKHGSYFLKLYQHRSYVLALRGAPDIRGMYVDASQVGLSFRRYGDLLLLGGGSHRTGKQGGGWRALSAFARKQYPRAKEVCRWATQDCMTLDGIPYIGRYASHAAGLYVATGFNKWGMTSSMVAAEILTDLVQGKDSPYAEVFSPVRSIFRKQLAINAMEAAAGLLTPTVPRCPHMGCALRYNDQEHSWDCACHGSRFTKGGRLLNNPANDDKR